MNAEQLLQRLRSQGRQLVIAESLTGGLLSYQFAKVAGASDVLLASVVAYDTALKHELLGVSSQLLENQGPVDPEVAFQMAEGLRQKIAIQKNLPIENLVALATTGVAGPAGQGEKPVGELYIAISLGAEGATESNVWAHQLAGSRQEIQETAVSLTLEHLAEQIAG
jgi:nicotinamide-nucleotide amidase